ncbi:hypothetical protein SDC9_151169 [bioreactor metagenome]|uniref:Uncharacterized protein n=1 Tax=bioreactor metagenome TaxID=1076179 RepID=A0A645ETV8_9ZZZZ
MTPDDFGMQLIDQLHPVQVVGIRYGNTDGVAASAPEVGGGAVRAESGFLCRLPDFLRQLRAHPVLIAVIQNQRHRRLRQIQPPGKFSHGDRHKKKLSCYKWTSYA